ncbi:hypothetical protein BT96DRAFT_942495 [Gymnopus androsaceus JB14]|uniref:ER-bound oxygenase mpaB/mpaB'/Rubber oxygenase catalytic domain-containing protein n=1 Tax=Gymnopus androsaceus JB14 TaxID=1447944 RepID=A0A6A4HAN8_9AGAR|nr:hypothetical protein BT96DRAFT_942495 [Gymnopus androsaceus JB14]
MKRPSECLHSSSALRVLMLLSSESFAYRRVNGITSKFSKDELAKMTPWTAQQVVFESFFYDTPMMMLLGTQVALFKVYGITWNLYLFWSSVASLLLQTGELKSPDTINKRLADTSILIATFLSNPLVGAGYETGSDDPRAAIAIARINYLHRKYPISNDDFLYNLALFMLEPIRWTARFDWRPHSPIELVQAIFVLWTEAGRRMGIKDIWSSYEEMEEWVENYEEVNMVPSAASAELAHTAINHILARIRIRSLRPLFFQLMLTVLDARYPTLIHTLFKTRAFVVRHLRLPRRKPAIRVQLDNQYRLDENGIPRMSAVYQRRSGPYYFPEKTGFALKVQDFLVRIGWKNAEKLPGKKWSSEGYRLEELGPVRFKKEGHEQVMQEAALLQGCPVTGPWASVREPGDMKGR